MNDFFLIKKLKSHDKQTFYTVIEKYTPYVSVILYRTLNQTASKEDLEELTSDVFISLWYNVESLTGNNLSGYLATIARNKAKNYLRSLSPLNENINNIQILVNDNTSDISIHNDQHNQLLSAINSLGFPDDEIFKMYYFDGLKTNEIAKALALSHATVRTKLFRGKHKLKKYFNERGIGYEELI